MIPAIRKIGGTLGGEVVGFDTLADHPDEVWEAIRVALAEYCVLVFRDQQLSDLEAVAVCDRVGETMDHWNITPEFLSPETNKVYRLSTRPGGARYAGSAWHADYSFIDVPADYSCLHLRTVPSVGGDTGFANMYTAFDELSERMQTMLDGLHAVHNNANRHKFYARDNAPTEKAKLAELPPVIHPLVVEHPITRRKALYVGEATVEAVVGIPARESKAILDFLFAHCAQPQFIYRHVWRPNDFVLFDNRCASHCAISDYDLNESRQGIVICARDRTSPLRVVANG